MAEVTSMADILNRPIEDIKQPVALPVGTYLCVIDGQYEITKLGKNNYDCVNFNLKPVQAQGDVDQQALREALDGKPLTDKKIRHRYWLTNDAAWRIKQFLVDHLGIEPKPIGMMLPETPGRQVMVSVGHRSSEDGTQVYQEVRSTAKV